MFLSAEDVKPIADRLLARSKADACEIRIDGGEEQTLRFARASATTNMATQDLSLRISSHVGGRVGSVTTSTLEPERLDAALARSEEIARLLPVDPDYVAPLGPQEYAASNRYDEATGRLALDDLASAAASVIAEGERRGVDTFGCATSGRRFEALATSNGLFAYDRRSEIDLSTTARNRTDDWSGWAGANEHWADRLDAAELARRACDKAAYQQAAADLDPGRYTVIFEPAATAELARWLINSLAARPAEEGRSFFSKAGNATKLGERVFDENLSLTSGPDDPLAPESAIGFEGLPHKGRSWIERGSVACFYRSRAYAKRTGGAAVPHPRSFTMAGGDASLDEMIGATKRGVLVTRLWYTNMVDPQRLLLTGLTRDGNFLIENGRIVGPARNLRFNESLGTLFSRILALGPTARCWRPMGASGAAAAPAMLVEEFTFSSRSSGV
jgi:predicted Zn-dependent protease